VSRSWWGPTLSSVTFPFVRIARKASWTSSVMHAEMRIGDSMLMLSESTGQFGPTPTSIYLYVTDCDAVYQSAVDAGGVSVFPIMTLPSGERYGGIKDPCGNIWWVATHVEDVPPDEEERRWKDFKMP
jgi:PhnB protein